MNPTNDAPSPELKSSSDRLTGREAVAEGKELGPVLAIYRGRRLGRGDILGLLLPGSLSVLAPLAYGLWQSYYAYTQFGPVAAEARSRPWFLLASLALAVFAVLLLFRLRQASQLVTVRQHGLHYRFPPARAGSLRWQDMTGITAAPIQEYFLGFPLRAYWLVKLHPMKGSPVSLDNTLRNLPELISRIKAGLYPHLLPRLRARLRAGDWISFGPLDLHAQTFRLRGREFLWTEVEHIDAQSGYLTIELKNQVVHRIPISRIPNIELLLKLIQQGVHV